MGILPVAAIAFSGLLAGEELIVRWGVAPAMSALPDPAHLRIRVALVRRLRVLVPGLIVPTVVLVLPTALWAVPGPWSAAAVGALVVFITASALGTVPINMKVIDWDPDQPPTNWRAVIARWEAIDLLRSSSAVASFALLALALP